VDAIMALTHTDIAAPAFGVGMCWAGFLAIADQTWEPLLEEPCQKDVYFPLH
jgi:nitroreductase